MDYGTQYLTFVEYRELGGSLTENAFNLLEYSSRKELDLRTQNRVANLTTIPSAVKLCIYEMIDKINSINQSSENINKNIASESVGSYNVSYVTGSNIQETIKANKKELDDVIMRNLFGVLDDNKIPLIYNGVV